MSEQTYDGWSNWQTWNAFERLTGDDASARHFDELAGRLDENELAEVIRDELGGPVKDMPSGWHADVVLQALSTVDYRELARAFQARAKSGE